MQHAAGLPRHPILVFLLSIAVLLAAGFKAVAGETLVESLTGRKHFAPMWSAGIFELGAGAGFSWARIITDGKGGGTFASNVRPYEPVIDATGKFVKVWVKVDDVSKLGGMEFRLSSDRFGSNSFSFDFPTYDEQDFNVLRDGVWTTLTFSFGNARIEGKPDRSAVNSIGWYVADKGNDGPVTAYWGGMSLVAEPAEGVATLTFDGGYDDHLLAARLMAKHGFRGTAYVSPDEIGQPHYLTPHQLVDLQETYGWDVAAHYSTPFTQLRPDELETTILGIQRYLTRNEFEAGAQHLAYPFGRQDTSLVRPLVRKHFRTARIAAGGPETLPPADPHLLRVFDVTDQVRPEQVAAAAVQARENKEWLILVFHLLAEEPTNSQEYSLKNFERILAQLARSEIRVLPLTDVWRACNPSLVADGESCRLPVAPASPRR